MLEITSVDKILSGVMCQRGKEIRHRKLEVRKRQIGHDLRYPGL